MRKIFVCCLVAVGIVGSVSMALAANPDTGPGCGLGKLAWSDYQGQKQIAPQVLMATTNGTFGSQTFGISSGTSGCTNDGTILNAEKVNVFAAINFENLSQEMAQGQGEHLASLASLMGIPPEYHKEFFVMVQARYASLIQSGETSPSAVIKALSDSMVSHPMFAQLTTPPKKTK